MTLKSERLSPGMHGPGKTSDAVSPERRHCLRVGAVSLFFFFSLTRHRLRPICAKSGWFVPTWSVSGETADSSRNSEKRKKKCKTHWLNLITNPNALKAPFFTSIFQLSRRGGTCSTGTHNNTTATVLARDKVSCNIKRLWLPQNALWFVFYWTPKLHPKSCGCFGTCEGHNWKNKKVLLYV